jgi:hypothetical protein
VRYAHTVTNGSPDEATVDLRVTSSQGWRVRLLDGDGESALRDSDDDGLIDVGELEPGERARITVELAVPELVAGGTLDVTTVTASTAGTSKTASAKDRTTVNGKIILTIDTTGGTADVPPSGLDETASLEGAPAVITGSDGGAVDGPGDEHRPVVGWLLRSGRPGHGRQRVDRRAVRLAGPRLGRRLDGVHGRRRPGLLLKPEPGNLTYTYEYAADDPADGEDEPPVVTYRVIGDAGRRTGQRLVPSVMARESARRRPRGHGVATRVLRLLRPT